MIDDFISEWIKRAEREENGSVFQFVCYYIAFNHLYNGEECCGGSNLNELCLLKKCVGHILETNNFAPYNNLSTDSELLKGVRSERLDRGTNKTKLQNKDVEELFTSIYYVRCNLFHGSKSMHSERNKKLVIESCKVLRSLFDILNKT